MGNNIELLIVVRVSTIVERAKVAVCVRIETDLLAVQVASRIIAIQCKWDV